MYQYCSLHKITQQHKANLSVSSSDIILLTTIIFLQSLLINILFLWSLLIPILFPGKNIKCKTFVFLQAFSGAIDVSLSSSSFFFNVVVVVVLISKSTMTKRSVYSHTCYAYCQHIANCLFLHFRSIHLHFLQNLSQNFPCVGCGQHTVPVEAHRIKWVTLLDADSRVECPRNINRLKNHDFVV